jgi:superfamily II DNA or RNA helicase
MWEDELKRYMITNFKVMTYQTAVNRMQRNGLTCRCLICDECHRLATPVQGRVLEMQPRYVLGLSATPEGALDILGKPLVDIDVNQANLCEFTVHYTSFPMSASERAEYDDITRRMRSRASQVTDGMATSLPPGRDSYGWGSYDALARKRRDIVYKQTSRIPYTVALVKRYITSRIIIYTERRETMHRIVQALMDEGIQSVDDSNIQAYEDERVNVMVLCGRLREGFNSVTTNIVIMASINTGVIKNVQTIGRALRVDPNNPDKRAHIFLLIAQGTSDESVIRNTGAYYKGHSKVSTIQQELGQNVIA